MKILATIDVTPGADMQKVRASLEEEIRGSWALFTSGVLREAYATATPSRVVFVLEAADIAEARGHLAHMPLVAGGLVQIELTELRPFAGWSLLFRT